MLARPVVELGGLAVVQVAEQAVGIEEPVSVVSWGHNKLQMTMKDKDSLRLVELLPKQRSVSSLAFHP